jgi:hypothetical protein
MPCGAPSIFIWSFSREKFLGRYTPSMRKAIGFVIILWALSHFLNQTFVALNSAAAQSFKTIETAAVVAQERLIER